MPAGKFVLKNAVIDIDGVDLSTRARSVTVETNDADVDLTAFQSAATEHGKGLKDATITVDFFQDFGVAQVDATLWPLSNSDDVFEVGVKAFDEAVSATNPRYKLAEARLFGYSPIAGGVGDASTTNPQFQNAGEAGLERTVA